MMKLPAQIKTAADVKKLGTILSVWAHPDDETFLSGGLMNVARANGQTVVCITATRGEKGVYNPAVWPIDSIASTRDQELKVALNILGVDKTHCLGCVDGECSTNDHLNDRRRLREWIIYYKPDTILTFGTDGWTGHPDHISISKWVDEAVAKIGQDIAVYHAVTDPAIYKKYLKKLDDRINVFYNIDKPPLSDDHDCAIHFSLPKDTLNTKMTALKAMPSQTNRIFESVDDKLVAQALSQECFCRAG